VKIIASISSDKFLLEATDDEIAQITGNGSAWAVREKWKPAVGLTVQVSALWKALDASRERTEELAALAVKLRNAADKVDSINKAVKAPIIEVKTS
jgi:TfoX/Sxy family transcriptional regulator of competence genes